jgi:hypothetical protein
MKKGSIKGVERATGAPPPRLRMFPTTEAACILGVIEGLLLKDDGAPMLQFSSVYDVQKVIKESIVIE